MHYGEFLRRLKRATTFVGVRGRTGARLGKDPGIQGALRARHRPLERKRSWGYRAASFTGPGLIILGFGVLNDFAGAGGRRVPWHLAAALLGAIALVLAARAYAATETKAMRAVGIVASLLFPVYLVASLVLF